jgi:serine/threonine protein kinase
MKKTILYYPTKKDPIYGWLLEDEVMLASGFSGDVFKVCKEQKCDYVMKVIKPSKIPLYIKREICMQKICSEHNLCKPVVDFWLLQGGGGVIVTQVLEETLNTKLMKIEDIKGGKKRKRLKWEIIKQAIDLILRLHQIGIIHRDAHVNNIMFDDKGRIFFIDTGISYFMNETQYYQYKWGGLENQSLLLPNLLEDYSRLIYFFGNPISVMLNNLDYLIEVEINKYVEEGIDLLEAEKKTINKILKLKYYDLKILIKNTIN